MKLILKTLTPLAILDGNELSPIGDFYRKDGMVFYIDHEKVKNFIADKPDLLESYVTKTKSAIDNNRVNISFDRDIIQNIFRSQPNDFVKYSVPAKGFNKQEKMLIKTIIKTAGRPYIPGSSIKGAIKTALLYDWFVNNQQGETFIENLIIRINNNVEYNNWQFKRELERDLERQLSNYANIRVSDSSYTSIENTFVMKTHRLHLSNQNKQGMIPIASESIFPNIEFSCEIDLSKSNNINSFNSLADKLTEYNRQVLYYEEDLLRESKDKVVDGVTFNSIIDNYDFLDTRIYNNEDKMYLRLGFGKSNFNQSIVLAIFNKDKDAFQKYRKIFKMGEKNGKMAETFPLTRSITAYDNSQLGWVEISKI